MKKTYSGFSLTEIMIALAFMGILAVFTVPKIIDTTTNSQYNSRVKQAVMTINAAFQAYQNDNTVTSSTSFADLTPYMNYVRQVGTAGGTYDRAYGESAPDSVTCSISYSCTFLTNGSVIVTNTAMNFGGTNSTNAMYFWVDPDSKYSGSSTGSGKSARIFLYYDGRVKSWGNIDANTTNPYGTFNPSPSNDPPWLSW